MEEVKAFEDLGCDQPGQNGNSYYSPQLLNVIMKKYIAFLPFWTKILTYKRFPGVLHRRPNNGMIEGYIGELKTIIRENKASLGKFGTIRVGRYIEKKKELIDVQVAEIKGGYSQSKFQREVKSKPKGEMLYEQLAQANENWKGKGMGGKKKGDSLFFSKSQS